MTTDNELIIRPADFTRIPWKNGQGWTEDIHKGYLASLEPATEPDGWDWRLSIAQIDADAPFSQFEGIDRQLFLVSGNGMTLHFDDESFVLEDPLDGVEFTGEEPVAAQLRDGGTTDFNLMWRRRRARVLSVVLETESQVDLMVDEIMGLYAQEGTWQVGDLTVEQGAVGLIHSRENRSLKVFPQTHGRALNFLVAPSGDPEDA